MNLKDTCSTGVVDGKSKDEHVTSGQADDRVGDTRKDSYIGVIIICVSPHFGLGTSDMFLV